jgi:Protein of unknown function (DUF2283)
MQSVYFEADDTLCIRVSEKPVVRETSPSWHVHLSHAEDGSIVEFVFLDAKQTGLLPIEVRKTV